jgi:hypothetical protein
MPEMTNFEIMSLIPAGIIAPQIGAAVKGHDFSRAIKILKV